MNTRLYPLLFNPIFKERIWGGRKLEQLYQKPLPPGQPIGESWEISDRPGDESVIANGPLSGKTLRWLMEEHGRTLLGSAKDLNGRFPLLVKILDAQQDLSLQVHPPAHLAASLGGEPKTEMWYVSQAEPGAELMVGLRRGVTREQFEEKTRDGTVADCFHRVPVQAGSVMFLPSGRVHALGAGNVIFEIQQNSDTTYRVFDWNRKDASGQPRELHLSQSMASIDFNDFEPSPIESKYSENVVMKTRFLVNDPLFRVDAFQIQRNKRFYIRLDAAVIVGMIEGRLGIRHEEQEILLKAGQFCLLPASLERVAFWTDSKVTFLQAQPG